MPYAISRLQSPGGFAYWAVRFRRRGRSHYKSFYDLRRGGARKALADAIAWRDRQLRSVGALTKREFRDILRSDNRSGVPGVLFIRPKSQPMGSWQAKMRVSGGKSIARTFAVGTYGERGAFRLAVAARQRMVETVEDRLFLHSATARKIAAERSSGPAKQAVL